LKIETKGLAVAAALVLPAFLGSILIVEEEKKKTKSKDRRLKLRREYSRHFSTLNGIEGKAS
jgi:hypothetical protein